MAYTNIRNEQTTTTYKDKLLRYHPNGFVVNYCLKKNEVKGIINVHRGNNRCH